MSVRVEVWPVAADELGIWLVSGTDAWRPSLPVMSDSEPHAEVQLELAKHHARSRTALLHSTSWRVDGPAAVLTYIAALHTPGLVRDTWPDAQPISPAVIDRVGTPRPGPPTEPPTPRYIDVLMHGIRHLRFLLDSDAAARDALTDHWPGHLAEFEPALALMYQDHRVA